MIILTLTCIMQDLDLDLLTRETETEVVRDLLLLLLVTPDPDPDLDLVKQDGSYQVLPQVYRIWGLNISVMTAGVVVAV